MTLYEITDATRVINNVVKDDADVIIGTAVNEAFQNEIQITVIATGFTEKPQGAFSTQQMSAAEYFQGKSTSTTETSFSKFSFSLDVPDFLRKS
jgi:cell division protein FtsZ